MSENPCCRIVAHRGASHDAPENTIAAFKLAWEQDADAIEGDFFLTADHEIVCIHDNDTTRLAGQQMLVEESTFADLSKLDVGLWKGPQFEHQRIPRLRDVLAIVPAGKAIVIELKTGKRIVSVLMDQLANWAPAELDVLMISFDTATISECKSLMPQYTAHWLTEVDEHSSPLDIAETLKRTRADGVGLQNRPTVIDHAFVSALRQHGCDEFHVWTVDEVAEAKHYQTLGAAGITTNVPAVIGAALRQ